MSATVAGASLAGVLGVVADVTTPDPDDVTPGVVGFIVTFLVAVATLFLIIDMVRRVRRVTYRAQVREEIAAEQAATAAAESDPAAVTGSQDAPRASGDAAADGEPGISRRTEG